MTARTVIVKGVVHGRTIELAEDSGIPEGQTVSVALRPVLPAGEGLRRSFGAWAKDADELQQFVEEIRVRREDDRTEPRP